MESCLPLATSQKKHTGQCFCPKLHPMRNTPWMQLCATTLSDSYGPTLPHARSSPSPSNATGNGTRKRGNDTWNSKHNETPPWLTPRGRVRQASRPDGPWAARWGWYLIALPTWHGVLKGVLQGVGARTQVHVPLDTCLRAHTGTQATSPQCDVCPRPD